MQRHKKELFKDTEDKLYKYFNRDNITKGLNSQLSVLDKQITDAENELKDCSYISIEEQSSSPSFDERVQTSSTGISYAESQIMKLTNIKLERMNRLKLEREEILKDKGLSLTLIIPLPFSSFFFNVRKVKIGRTTRSMYLSIVSA